MIAAITSKGRVFSSINQGKNTTTTFAHFLVRLCRELEQRDRDWRSKSVILLDNASIHRSREAFRYYEAIQIPVMFLAPYSFEMAAVERLFAFIKNRDLNPLSAIKYSR